MKGIKRLHNVVVSLLMLGGIGGVYAQGTQPLVAIHDSELTRAMENQVASNGTPSGFGTSGNQWWPTDWHYFVMPESLKEAFRSDGTAFTVLGDSNITAGALLTNGVPKYPIFISLSSEAMRDDEISPLTNYVAAGGFLFVGGSSFTRNTNGTSRGDFALANAMGVHMVVSGLTNWGLDSSLTTLTNNRIVNDLPTGSNTWRLPAFSEEINWGYSPSHVFLAPHDVWQVQAGGATALARGDVYPYILIKQYGKGYFIYDASFQPLIGHGGFAPGMYAYMIFRRSIEWAFENANLPVLKLSPWPYKYDSAFMVRHDLENFGNEVADITNSVTLEAAAGVKADYYFCTGTLRQDMSSTYNTNAVIKGLRFDATNYGASFGPHNGGLKNPDNSALLETNGVGSSYDYWHWGPDEVLDFAVPAGYANGTAYAAASLSNSFLNIESWFSGIENSSMRLWVAPNFNGTREGSYSNQAALGVKIAGDQKISPFPHWTLSTQTPGLRYATLSEPVSDWYVGGLVAQSLEPWHPPGVHTQASMQTAVDFYYNLGFLINIYSHTLSDGNGDAGPLTYDYITYCVNTNLHPRLWSANAIGIYNWWLARSNAQINVSFNTNGNQSVATFSISHATDPNTTVELYIPANKSFCSLQVFTNGVIAGTNGFRVNGNVIKVLAGTTVSNVIVSYYPLGAPVNIFSQNFDSVTAPALPSGWTSSASGVQSPWVTEKTVVDTAPNGVFVPDPTDIGLSYLTSPTIAIPPGQAQLTFMNNYDLEPGPGSGYDGGVLEIKIGAGAFTDIIAAGGSFVTGAYNYQIDTNYGNPLAGRMAWSGTSAGFVPTTVNLPPSAAGQNVQLRWGCGTDNGNGRTGWRIDTISITNQVCGCCSTNTPPILPSQSSLTVPELTTMIVTNTATDTNFPPNALTYQLISPPSGAVITNNGIITWTPSQNQSPGVYSITTVVSDNGGPPLTATNSFNVTVAEVNVAPSLPATGPQTMNEFATLIITNAATEPNIHSVTTGYGLLTAPGGAGINGSGVITWTPQQSQSPGTYAFTVVVTNSNPYDTVNPTLTATNSFNVTVKEVNVRPTLGFIGLQTIGEFSTLTVANAATETNIHSVTTGYNLLSAPGGATINGSGVITWTPQQAQSHTTNLFTTVVTNNNPYDTVNPTLTATNSFTVVVKEVNVAPILGNIGPQTVNEFVTLTVTNAAVETNVNSVTTGYGILSAPSGVVISGAGVITWTPQQNQSHSTNVITTVVTNNNPYDTVNPTLTATNSFTVVVKEVNVAPTLGNIGPQTVNEFATLTVTNAAVETNVNSVTTGYGILSAPSGVVINGSGVITWTPQQSQSHSTNVIMTVVTNSNPYDTINPTLTATNSFTVVVKEVNVAPTLGNIGPQAVNEFATLTVTNAAVETNMNSVTTGYGILSAPSGVGINGSGVITWTPQQSQSHSTNVIMTVVTNSNPYDTINPTLTATNSFTVVVKEVNVAPTLGNIGPQTVNEFGTLTVTNAAVETNVNSVTTGYGILSAPSGVGINGSGVITWSPQQSQSHSTNVITTVVTNNNPYDTINPTLTATNSFTVIVKEVNVAPTLGNIGPQTVSEFATLTVTNAAVETNVNSVTTGYNLLTAPGGATINGTGVIIWSPTQAQSHSTNVFTTVVTNNNPYDAVNPTLTATNSFMVVVKEVNVAPTLGNIGLQTVNELATLTVTNAAVETNVNSVTAGYGLLSAPSGVVISGAGVITWTPQQNQSHSTNVIMTVVTNNNPYDTVNPTLTATNSFTVVVKELNVAPVLPAQNDTNINELATLVVTNAAVEPNTNSMTTGYGLINPPNGAIIDTNGVITWTPGQDQSPGTNVITTVVTNSNPFDTVNPSLITSNSFTVVVNEVNMAPVLPVQNGTNVNELATLVITNTAGEPNIHSVTVGYGLINPPAGAAIDTNGVITWMPGQNQSPGTYTITTVVTNSNPYDIVNPSLVASNSFAVAVNEVNVAPALPAQNDTNINELATLVVTNAAAEPNIHSITVGYGLINPPAGAVINTTNGIITWTPQQNQSPSTNVLTTVVTNSNPYDSVQSQMVATNSFTVIVNEVNLPPILPVQMDMSGDENTTLILTNAATEPNIHSVTIGYGLINPPTGASIDTNGVITWMPTDAEESMTNVLTTVVTNFNPYDLVNPMLTATNSFNGIVMDPVVSPFITSVKLTNGVATVTWTTVPGHNYTLQYQDDGTNWIDVVPSVMAFGSQASMTNAIGGAPHRLYQVITAPQQFHHHH